MNMKTIEEVAPALRRALALHATGKVTAADVIYDQVLLLEPENATALHMKGVIALQQGDVARGLQLVKRAVLADPQAAAIRNSLANALRESGQPEEALVELDQALALKPDYSAAYNNRGSALLDLGRAEEALASYARALELEPDNAATLNNRGNALAMSGRLDEALASYERAVAVSPDYADALFNQGNILRRLGRAEEAVDSYRRALECSPRKADVLCMLGTTLCDVRRFEEALTVLDRAIQVDGGSASCHFGRGNALLALKRPQQALESFDAAIRLGGQEANVWNNRGNALRDLGLIDEAIESYTQATKISPDLANAFYNLGHALNERKRPDEARLAYERALELAPDYDFLAGICINARMVLCDWRGFEDTLQRHREAILAGKRVTTPFPCLSLLDEPELHKRVAQIFAEAKYPPGTQWGEWKARPADRKIRLGYYSADFHNHATSYLIAEMLELHDRSRFELYAFSFGASPQDEMRRRVAAAFDQFLDVRTMSDLEVARESRRLGIDIAVDLKGYTQQSRPGIFAERPAPLQVSYLGYPGTTGVAYMDYVIADKTVIPETARRHFTEKVVSLPYSYQPNDRKRPISRAPARRADHGLPDGDFVFCCFNNNYKILPGTFDSWIRILRQVPRSVLWLLEDNPTAARNLRAEAETRGLDSRRLVFAQRMPLAGHLSRLRLADLFLDTLPCNAHTTASDALWAGVPVLTCIGSAFAGRVAASLLGAVDLSELVTTTMPDYEREAVRLANDAATLRAIRSKLEGQRHRGKLFDTRSYTRNLEAAYQSMYGRLLDGLPAVHMDIVERGASV